MKLFVQQDTGTLIRMSGALPEEIREVSQTANKQVGSRIIGFEEEEQRAKLRAVRDGKRTSSLPSGPYTFSAFRTLQLPGVEVILGDMFAEPQGFDEFVGSLLIMKW